MRAYAQSEGSGDSGVQGTLELRYKTGDPRWTLAAYLDSGRVRLAKSEGDYRTLTGCGLGLEYSAGADSFFRLDYAWKINAQRDVSEDKNDSGHFWFQAVQRL